MRISVSKNAENRDFLFGTLLLYNGASKNERDFLQGGYTNGYEKGIGSNQK